MSVYIDPDITKDQWIAPFNFILNNHPFPVKTLQIDLLWHLEQHVHCGKKFGKCQ